MFTWAACVRKGFNAAPRAKAQGGIGNERATEGHFKYPKYHHQSWGFGKRGRQMGAPDNNYNIFFLYHYYS